MEQSEQETDRVLSTAFLKIGNVRLDSRLVLAPMAGITDLPFRILCRRFGAGLVVSEMISAEGLARGQRGSEVLLRSTDEERPVAFQLFGARPDSMAAAAEVLVAQGADVVDINMGCPVRKVVCKGAGSALMREPDTAVRVIGAVVRVAAVPVTVKIRSGWDASTVNAVEFARMAEGEGAQGITVHARTSRQMFGGRVDLSVIGAVKEAVSIPVIGNGDVREPADIERMLHVTGCDAVMIGRGCLGNPWIFARRERPAGGRERLEVFRDLAELVERWGSPKVSLFRLKKQAQWFAKGLPGAAEFRAALYHSASTREAVLRLVENYLGGREESAALT